MLSEVHVRPENASAGARGGNKGPSAPGGQASDVRDAEVVADAAQGPAQAAAQEEPEAYPSLPFALISANLYHPKVTNQKT